MMKNIKKFRQISKNYFQRKKTKESSKNAKTILKKQKKISTYFFERTWKKKSMRNNDQRSKTIRGVKKILKKGKDIGQKIKNYQRRSQKCKKQCCQNKKKLEELEKRRLKKVECERRQLNVEFEKRELEKKTS